MKVSRLITIAAIGALGTLGPMAADKTAGKESVTSIEKVRSDLLNLSTLVMSSSDALQKVKDTAQNSGDLKGALKNFSEKYQALESQTDGIRANVTAMKARTKAFHEAWLKELENMKNPKLKEKASSRYQDVKEEFDKIIETGDEAKRSLVPFVTDLKDINVYLEADSSPDAVKSLSHTIWKLNNQSRSVAGDLKNVVEQIDKTLEKTPSK